MTVFKVEQRLPGCEWKPTTYDGIHEDIESALVRIGRLSHMVEWRIIEITETVVMTKPQPILAPAPLTEGE